MTARAREAAGADMVVLSAGRNIESTWAMFGSALPYDDLAAMQGGLLAKLQCAVLKRSVPKLPPFHENYLMEPALKLKAALGQTPMKLAYLGGIQSLAGARQAAAEGFDAIALARAMIHDPALIAKWQSGASDVSGCTACNRCVAAMYGRSGTHCPEVGADNPDNIDMNATVSGARRYRIRHTRYDRCADIFLAAVTLACIFLF